MRLARLDLQIEKVDGCVRPSFLIDSIHQHDLGLRRSRREIHVVPIECVAPSPPLKRETMGRAEALPRDSVMGSAHVDRARYGDRGFAACIREDEVHRPQNTATGRILSQRFTASRRDDDHAIERTCGTGSPVSMSTVRTRYVSLMPRGTPQPRTRRSTVIAPQILRQRAWDLRRVEETSSRGSPVRSRVCQNGTRLRPREGAVFRRLHKLDRVILLVAVPL